MASMYLPSPQTGTNALTWRQVNSMAAASLLLKGMGGGGGAARRPYEYRLSSLMAASSLP
jgi:hypothetical protein